jgi:hypothetical protein
MEANVYSITRDGKVYYITEDYCVFKNVFDAKEHAIEVIKEMMNRNRLTEAWSYINIK